MVIISVITLSFVFFVALVASLVVKKKSNEQCTKIAFKVPQRFSMRSKGVCNTCVVDNGLFTPKTFKNGK
jgi:hypothetical protein